jgi:hypothetical protein
MSARTILALCLVLAVLGWVALGSFTYHNPPEGWNRWIATAMLGPTLWATFLPLVYLLHKGQQQREGITLVVARRTAFVALFLALCVGLRLVGALSWANAALLLALCVLVEALSSGKNPQ